MNIVSSENIGKRKLLALVLRRFGSAIIILGLILFIPAGSLEYWNAWVYLLAILVPMLVVFIYLYINDPSLLEKRMKMKEKEKEQKLYVRLSILLFLISFVLPGLDFRYRWTHVPVWLVITSVGIMILGYALFAIVMIQNSYASRVIEIQEKQKLIDTGLYSIVRHPMYMAATIIYLATPLILGSYYALISMIFLPFLLGFRIINEEKILHNGLQGYIEYEKKVKYRLIPFIW
jgi:protein-S-isoprenylcysteine O-methyltransferase Ste14